MLDSTGSRIRTIINCFICGNPAMKFDVWTPHYGHAGEKLNVGRSIRFSYLNIGSPDRILNNSSKLFEIKPNETASRDGDPIISFNETKLVMSREPYHYNGYVLPKFGNLIGNTVCVCATCLSKPDLSNLLENAYTDKLGRNLEFLIYDLFAHGWLSISSGTGSCRRIFLKRIETILNELKKVKRSRGSVIRARQRLTQLERVLSKKKAC